VYKPRETAVLAAARSLGLTCVDGLGMLLHQGAMAFELWTHTPAPLEIMRAALAAD
jgi:shikimate dehydrogenase